jgi:hypothetical protein
MNWNSIPNEERLTLWKNLRIDIQDKNLETQLKEIAKFCSTIPFGTRTLDYYSPDNWPTPWEILFHGSFCTSSISLLMFYTLTLLSVSADVELVLVEDSDGIYLLPIIDNQYVLNYHLGQISKYPEIKDSLTVLKIYSKEQIKNIK